MHKIADDLYLAITKVADVENAANVTFAHDCKNYKDRDIARVVLQQEDDDTHVCLHCGFKVSLKDIVSKDVLLKDFVTKKMPWWNLL